MQHAGQLEALVRKRAKEFRSSYSELAKELFSETRQGKQRKTIFHPGEYGRYRERLLKNLLASFLPSYIELSEGFVIAGGAKRSGQTDVVLVDSHETPRIESDDLRTFYPIETIFGVGEVKSSLTPGKLRKALVRLEEIKRLRLEKPAFLLPLKPPWRVFELQYVSLSTADSADIRENRRQQTRSLVSSYDPIRNHWQNIVTFLVAESVTVGTDRPYKEVICEAVATRRGEEDFALRANSILSLSEGYQSFADGARGATPYPNELMGVAGNIVTTACSLRFVDANEDCDHIIAFVLDLCWAAGDVAIYPFTLAGYMKPPKHKIETAGCWTSRSRPS